MGLRIGILRVIVEALALDGVEGLNGVAEDPGATAARFAGGSVGLGVSLLRRAPIGRFGGGDIDPSRREEGVGGGERVGRAVGLIGCRGICQ